jgi:monofunctional biosynthetic peptidoglycan transglycosylase
MVKWRHSVPGIELLFVFAAVAGGATPDRTVFDFSRGAEPWPSIDDTVMGGRSASEMRIEEGTAVFTGKVSLENNGGFASVRSLPDDHDLSGYRGVSIRVRGDGKTYGLRLKTDRRFDSVSYQARLAPGNGEWKVVRIPFDEFRPVFRGRPVPGAPVLDPASIKSFGLIISDKQEGPFRLEIEWIGVWVEPSVP